MKRSHLLFILLLVLLLDVPVHSQNQKFGIPEIKNFNRQEYGGATQNWKITQGENDLMYFANNQGLLEYDGAHWLRYNDFGQNPIRCVKSIGDKVYCGANKEHGFYSYNKTNQLFYSSLRSSETDRFGEFWEILDWNNYIVFHAEKALCMYKDDKLERIIASDSRFISVFTVNGLLLVQDEKAGLLEIRGEQAFPVPGGDIIKGKIVSSMLGISENEIVIGTKTHGLFIWNMQDIQKWKTPVDALLMKLNVFCGMTYDNDFLAFGTILGGIVVTDKQGHIVMALNKDKGLKNNTILSLFTDREGNVWGGMDNGIVKVAFNSNVSFLQSYFNLGTGYVVSEFKNNFYFGTNQGLYKISKPAFSDPLKTPDDFYFIPEASGQVWSLFADDDGILCGHDKGIIHVNGSNAKLITPIGVNGAWVFKKIEGRKDLLLVGTYNGLVVIEKKSGGWGFRNKVKGFTESSRFLEWDQQGNLWMSHGDLGAFRIKLKDDFSQIEHVDTFSLSDFPQNEGGSPLILTKLGGECFFCGAKGLYKIEGAHPGKDNRFSAFFEEDNFPNRLLEDRFKNIWYFYLNTMGVLRFQEDGTFKKVESPFITIGDKQPGSFENIYQMNEGNTIFGIEDGFAHYVAGKTSNFSKTFKVHLRSFKSINDSVVYALSYLPETKQSNDVSLEYAFADNSFEVVYSASYFGEGSIQYSTFLSGYDDVPGAWTSSTSRQLLKIPEGEYELIVKARNSYGVVSKPISFSFKVHPPIHRSTLAKGLYILLLFLIISLLYRIINKRIDMNRLREREKQQERYRKQEEQLKREALAAEKEMIRLRNDKLRSDIAYKEKELANSTMNIIQKNEFLVRLKNVLKGFLESRDREELKRKVKQLLKEIDKDIDSKSYWEVFEVHLEQVHSEFLKRLRDVHPELSSKDQKLCAYIKMGMSSKEIATLMNISTRAVENTRYFLRQKLSLEKGQNLVAYIEGL